jgi:hypothetical protein
MDMGGLLSPVQWVWAFSVVAQIVVFALLLANGNLRKIPLFTTYVALNLSQAAFLVLLYRYFGTSSRTEFYLAWASEAATLLAQALAATEVLRIVLRPYQGIWGLGWRMLALVSIVGLGYVAVGTDRSLTWILLEVDRGYHLIFGTAVIACLVIARHYSIPIAPGYKGLLRGFCLFSCTIILASTIYRGLVYKRVAHYEAFWEFTSVLCFAVVQVVWAVALRRPLPAMEPQLSVAPVYVYQRVSPEINLRLHDLNERLLRLWRPEARPQ